MGRQVGAGVGSVVEASISPPWAMGFFSNVMSRSSTTIVGDFIIPTINAACTTEPMYSNQSGTTLSGTSLLARSSRPPDEEAFVLQMQDSKSGRAAKKLVLEEPKETDLIAQLASANEKRLAARAELWQEERAKLLKEIAQLNDLLYTAKATKEAPALPLDDVEPSAQRMDGDHIESRRSMYQRPRSRGPEQRSSARERERDGPRGNYSRSVPTLPAPEQPLELTGTRAHFVVCVQLTYDGWAKYPAHSRAVYETFNSSVTSLFRLHKGVAVHPCDCDAAAIMLFDETHRAFQFCMEVFAHL